MENNSRGPVVIGESWFPAARVSIGVLLLAMVAGLCGIAVPSRAAVLPTCPTSIQWTQGKTYVPGGFCLATDTDLFVYQSDGNLVWYINNEAQWSSGTQGRGQLLILQDDGNIVVYDANGGALYASSWGYSLAALTTVDQMKYLTLGTAWHSHFVSHQINLRTVGNTTYTTSSALIGLHWEELGVQNVSCTFEAVGINLATPARMISRGQLCWSNANGTLIFQDDGNFVLYVGGKARWNSRTAGRGALLALQSDGNVVVYDAAMRPLWAVSWVIRGWQPRDLTHGNGMAHFEVAPSGAIVYDSYDSSRGWIAGIVGG